MMPIRVSKLYGSAICGILVMALIYIWILCIYYTILEEYKPIQIISLSSSIQNPIPNPDPSPISNPTKNDLIIEETVVKPTVSPSRGGYDKRVVATAYCMGKITSTGLPVRRGIIAVDPKVIPYHSKVEIEGMGTFDAEDTGGDIEGDRIDIYMPSRGECMNFGRRELVIRVIRRGAG